MANILHWLRDVIAAPTNLSQIQKAVTKMADNIEEISEEQKALNALVADLQATIETEHQQVLDALNALGNKPLDISGVAALKAKIQGIYATTEPQDGKKNVSFGFVSDNLANGGEYFSVRVVNNNVTPERAELLKGIATMTKQVAADQKAGGEPFVSKFNFTSTDDSDSFETPNEAQKAAADVTFLTPFLGEAQAQLAKFNTTTASK